MSKEMSLVDQKNTDKTVFGFWVYIMTDCVLFATLFATYGVLRNNTHGGPGASELFSMPFILLETLVLLISSFTAGLALLFARQKSLRMTMSYLALTFVLGLTFLGMELYEFNKLIGEGYSWTSNAFLSSYFTLVGTHGLHITVGLLWLSIIMVFLYKKGFTNVVSKRLTLFGIFWHFLDIVWVFIFTIVYLLGAAS